MKAAKKAGRIARDGLIAVKMADDGQLGIMVEVNCETDFAARDENFVAFVQTVANMVFDKKSGDVDELLALGLETAREALVQKIGENISIRRAEVYSTPSVYSYVHTTNRIGVLVSLDAGNAQLGKDIAMHVAASAPAVISPDDVSEDVIAREREIYAAQAKESGKPPEIVAKMIDGRIRKYLQEISLTEQAFVKDPDVNVGALLKKENAKVTAFVRFEVGEGIEKESIDFAAEVANQLK